jgi:CRISPR type III-B/RAMP module RAMP protein Cmr1
MHYTFKAHTVTPLLIAGAKGARDSRDNDLRAEGLRPASVRGQLRYWFRTMMGSIVGNHRDYKTLQRLEAGIFGLTENSSSVRLRTTPVKASAMQFDLYPVRMNDCAPPRPRRLGAKAQEQFSIRLDLARSGRGEADVILGTLWLLAALGGVGGRIRRGFGSLAFTPEIGATTLDFALAGQSLSDLVRVYTTHLTNIKHTFQRYAEPLPVGGTYSTQHFVLRQQRARLWLIAPLQGFWSTWEDAMKKLRLDVYRSLKGCLIIRGVRGVREIGSGPQRQASPLWLQIKRNAMGGYFGVMLAFDTQGSVRSGSPDYFADPRNPAQRWTQLDAFMSSLTSVQTQEVSLP